LARLFLPSGQLTSAEIENVAMFETINGRFIRVTKDLNFKAMRIQPFDGLEVTVTLTFFFRDYGFSK